MGRTTGWAEIVIRIVNHNIYITLTNVPRLNCKWSNPTHIDVVINEAIDELVELMYNQTELHELHELHKLHKLHGAITYSFPDGIMQYYCLCVAANLSRLLGDLITIMILSRNRSCVQLMLINSWHCIQKWYNSAKPLWFKLWKVGQLESQAGRQQKDGG